MPYKIYEARGLFLEGKQVLDQALIANEAVIISGLTLRVFMERIWEDLPYFLNLFHFYFLLYSIYSPSLYLLYSFIRK